MLCVNWGTFLVSVSSVVACSRCFGFGSCVVAKLSSFGRVGILFPSFDDPFRDRSRLLASPGEVFFSFAVSFAKLNQVGSRRNCVLASLGRIPRIQFCEQEFWHDFELGRGIRHQVGEIGERWIYKLRKDLDKQSSGRLRDM